MKHFEERAVISGSIKEPQSADASIEDMKYDSGSSDSPSIWHAYIAIKISANTAGKWKPEFPFSAETTPEVVFYGIKHHMSLTNDVVAVWAAVLVGPAVLFVTALFVGRVPPLESQPARTANRIVNWYAAHPQLALWVLLLALPLSALILGSAALLRTWGANPKLQYFTWRALSEIPEHWPALSIGGAMLLAFGVLVMITSHLMAGQDQGRRPISH